VIKLTFDNIKHVFIVLSGKGGVGKSTVAVNLAVSLSRKGYGTGILDVDIHGPNVPKLLNLEFENLRIEKGKIVPVMYGNLKVMSAAFLLTEHAEAIIWRGPLKAGMIKQFLEDVDWGNLDYLVVDCPPGTGDEPLSVIQVIGKVDGSIIITTPQELSIIDVKKTVQFSRTLDVPVLGVIENMSGFVCPHCQEEINIFKTGGGEIMAKEMGVPFLGRIPIDPDVVRVGDEGKPFVEALPDSRVSREFSSVVAELERKYLVMIH
jgi:ATP-binding protein involved in chromosome partitioning